MRQTIYLLLFLLFHLNTKAQPTNPGFESWDSCSSGASCIYPSGWPLMDNVYLYRSTDAYEGNYALTVHVWYSYIKSGGIQQEPISSRPAYFNGYFKYTDASIKNNSLGGIIEPDTAEVVVAMSKWNNVTAHRDTIGFGKIKLTQSLVYAPFSCPVVYTGPDTPDTVAILLDPSRLRRYDDIVFNAPSSSECSYFTTDQLSFGDEMVGISGRQVPVNVRLYPNPLVDRLTVEDPGGQVKSISLYNTAGIMVPCTVTVTAGKKEVNVQALPGGMYTVVLIGAQGNVLGSEKLIRD